MTHVLRKRAKVVEKGRALRRVQHVGHETPDRLVVGWIGVDPTAVHLRLMQCLVDVILDALFETRGQRTEDRGQKYTIRLLSRVLRLLSSFCPLSSLLCPLSFVPCSLF